MADFEIAEAIPVPQEEMPDAGPAPEATANTIETPEPSATDKATPAPSGKKKAVPKPKPLDKEMPADVDPANCIKIGSRVFEIKPTKLKYFRNRTASIYSVLKVVPLGDFLSYDKGVFDKDRDSDQLLFDFLVAVFDDSKLVAEHYDDFNADDIERICAIFGRLNHIDEKEEKARKNREAQARS